MDDALAALAGIRLAGDMALLLTPRDIITGPRVAVSILCDIAVGSFS
jgi:hypothetical protein